MDRQVVGFPVPCVNLALRRVQWLQSHEDMACRAFTTCAVDEKVGFMVKGNGLETIAVLYREA